MPFQKHCMCGAVWTDRDAFLDDPEIEIIGFQAGVTVARPGFFLFNHLRIVPRPCRSTLALPVESFADLYDGPAYTESRKGEAECMGHCLRIRGTERCIVHCRNAWARELLYRLHERHLRVTNRLGSEAAPDG